MITIPTELSLHGFIATPPELSFGPTGHARFYCRVGIAQHRREADGSFTRLESFYCDLVLFDKAAQRAHGRFKPGDQTIASGYIQEYEQDRTDGSTLTREQFVARRIGHNCLRTRYTVDRGPAKQPAAKQPARQPVQSPARPGREAGVGEAPAAAVGS